MKAVSDPIALLLEAGCDEGVVRHCKKVRDVTGKYTHRFLIDTHLVETGALLHDIGRGTTHAIDHAQAGAEICRSLGLGEDITRIVEVHLGAGLTADECSLLGLLPRDCMPRTVEEKIVANADNLVKGRTEITIEERLLRSPHLPRRIKKRMMRLALEMELFK
jgi:uncharacterized protein